MVSQSFKLKRSRLAIVFQLLVLVVLASLLFQLLSLMLWLICMLIAIFSYVLCLRLPPALYLEHLDARAWSLNYAGQQEFKRVEISHVIDHRLYMVVYFQHFREKPLLIWCDQVTWTEWKSLKTLAKLI